MRSFSSVTYAMLLGFCLLITAMSADARELKQADLLDWAYHWGDAPVVDGKPDWPEGQDNWQSIRFPINPPQRNGQTAVWFKATLPELNLTQPVLFIQSIDLAAEIYLEGEKLYQFGELTAAHKRDFNGWPWHAVALPEDYANKTVYFRVWADYSDIGLWGEVKLFDKVDLLYYLTEHAYLEILIALFCLFVAILAFAFTAIQQKQGYFIYLGGFALMSALTLLAENNLVQFVFNYPLLRSYIAAATYYAMPIFMALLLASWLIDRYRKPLHYLALAHGGYLIGAMVASLMGFTTVAHTFPVFDVLFALSLIYMMTICIKSIRYVTPEQLWMMLSFAIFGVLLLVDMGVANGVLPWVRVNVAFGALCFSIVLVLISFRHYNQVQQSLRELNEHLEYMVQQRTAQLESYAQAEKNRAFELQEINSLNSRLEELNSRLQACHDLGQAQQLLDAELAGIFKPIRVYAVTRPALGYPIEEAVCQLTTQEMNGKSKLFAIVFLADMSDKHLLADPVLQSFIHRASQRLNVSLSNIKLREELHRFSFEDALTGLRNRRFFNEALSRDIHLAERHGTALALLICDIDHFKQFNDQYGHEAGDLALQAVADELRAHFRETDVPCRYGGEEFVVVLRGASSVIAHTKAELLRTAISKRQIRYQSTVIGHLTISIGVANWQSGVDAETLLRRADNALYHAKQAGRNRVDIFGEDTSS